MTNFQLKKALVRAGLKKEKISEFQYNFDVERISMVVEASSCPEIAFSAIHQIYPDLEAEELKSLCGFSRERFTSSIKEHFWKNVLVGVALFVCAALISEDIFSALAVSMIYSDLS